MVMISYKTSTLTGSGYRSISYINQYTEFLSPLAVTGKVKLACKVKKHEILLTCTIMGFGPAGDIKMAGPGFTTASPCTLRCHHPQTFISQPLCHQQS